jgi:tetratricopeptide (TPR) repeat protein
MTLNPHLTHLETSGLIQLAQKHPELEYLFRHALVQDAAYESLLLSDRQRLHEAVGETIEGAYPERMEELAPVLAHHFHLAGKEKLAQKYFTLAGDVARRMNALTEAVEHYGQALVITEQQANCSSGELIYLFEQYGRSLEITSCYQEAEATYLHMADVAAQREDRVMTLTAVIARATIYIVPSALFDPPRGRMLLEEALLLAQELEDKTAETRILWNLMLQHFYVGQIEQALPYGEAALALARQLQLQEQLAYILNDIAGYVYMSLGMYEEGHAALMEARTLWQELNNKSMLADNLCTAAFNYYYMKGEYTTALQLVEEAYVINRSIGNTWGLSYSRSMIGVFLQELGRVQESIVALNESIQSGEASGFLASQVIASSILAMQYSRLGKEDLALAAATLAVAKAESQVAFWLPLALGSLALVQIRLGDLAAAETVLGQLPADITGNDIIISYFAVVIARCELALARGENGRVHQTLHQHLPHFQRRGAFGFLPLLLYYEGEAWQAEGQPEKAQQAYHRAIQLAEQNQSLHNLWPSLVALSQIEPDPLLAQQWRQKAWTIIQKIIDYSPPTIQESFLNLPNIRALAEKV